MSENNKLPDGEVIVGRHYCPHCGGNIERYLWSAILQLEIKDRITLSARGGNILKQERVVSLLKMLGCKEIERKMIIEKIDENDVETLKVVIEKIKH